MASFQYHFFSRFVSLIPIRLRLQLLFYRRFNRLCSFNKPLTFNEKMQVRKIYDRNPLLIIAADKLASKDYVKKVVPDIYVPKTLWASTQIKDIDSINFELLPGNYVFKANHTSQTIRIIKDFKHLSVNKMKSLAFGWLKHDQFSVLGEWAYSDIPPTIFIEEFLDFEGREPDDYKFFVYHGRVCFIQLDSDRFKDHKRNMFDRDWNDLEIDFSHPRKIPSPNEPSFLSAMIDAAERIGNDFDFVRVDLYWYKGMVTFGEITIYPGAGFEKFPSLDWDVKFGLPWHQRYNNET